MSATKLADGAVSATKLAGSSVGTAAIANDSITFEKLAPAVRQAIQQPAPAPVPITPIPITPAPITPVPITPIPITPAPITPVPITPIPITPEPILPSPILTPLPIDVSFGAFEATRLTAPPTDIGKSVRMPSDVRPGAEARAGYQPPEVTLHPIRPSFDHVYVTWSSSLGRVKDSARTAVTIADRAPAADFRKKLGTLARRVAKLATAGAPTLALVRVLTDHLEPEALHAGKARVALDLLADPRLRAAVVRLAIDNGETHLDHALKIIDFAYENQEWAGVLLALARQGSPELLSQAAAAATAGELVGVVADADPEALPEILGGLAVPAPEQVPIIGLPPALAFPQVVMEVEATVRIATSTVCAVGLGSVEVPPPPGQLALVHGAPAPAPTKRKGNNGAPASAAVFTGQATITLRRRIRYAADLATARTIRLWISAYEQPATLVDVQLRAHTLGGHDPMPEDGGLWSRG